MKNTGKIIIWFLAVALGWMANLHGQTCLPGTLLLNSQQQIDDFPTNYPGCTRVLGNIVVTASDLTNLDGLGQLDTIDGNFALSNLSLTSLTGLALPNLEHVGGTLNISNNGALADLNGIADWLGLSDSLYIDNNNALTDLTGFESQMLLSGFFQISNNNSLTSLTGLDNVTFFFGSLHIDNNPALTSLAGMQSITSFNGDLEINYNTALPNLNALNGLTSLTGDLYIRGSASLTDLSGLESLVLTIGDLGIIDNDALVSFDGINALTSVDGDLLIEDNDALVDFNSLNSLSEVEGDLVIRNNSSLTSLVGLFLLPNIGEDLILENLPSLTSLAGPNNLSTIGDDFRLVDLPPTITDLTDFLSLDSITSDFHIEQTNLVSLAGLENITSLGGELYIHSSDQLEDLTALQNLTSIGGQLLVRWSDGLESLAGLENIDPASIEFLDLQGNNALILCQQQVVCNYLASGGPYNIEDNGVGCSSNTEILNICFPPDPVIQGRVYVDENANCSNDAEEGLEDMILRISDGSNTVYTTTDVNGSYTISLLPGTYELEVINYDPDFWSVCNGVVTNIVVDISDVEEIDFGMESVFACPKLSVDISNGQLRPCVPTTYELKYCNKGTVVAPQGRVAFTLSDGFTFIGSTPISPIAVIGGVTYVFDVGELSIGDCGSLNVSVIYDPDCDSFVEGQTACVSAQISSDSICALPTPGWDGSSLRVSGVCEGDSIRFRITNASSAAMSASTDYIVIEDNIMMLKGQVDLGEGDSMDIVVPTFGGTIRLEAEQSANHPGDSRPSVTVEGCDPDGDGVYSLGYYLQWPQDDVDDFKDIECMEVVGSGADNFKTADPAGIMEAHCLKDDVPVEYTIRFRNSGVDTVQQVVVRDSISPLLDLATIQPGSASHPYDFEMVDGGIAQFTFSNINLPDSTISFENSDGFVSFKIWQQPGNPGGALIQNEANIFFDSLPGLISNTVFHTIENDYCIDSTAIIDSALPPSVAQPILKVYPNPMDGYTLFELAGEHPPFGKIIIYELRGTMVQELEVAGPKTVFYRKGLPSGVYLYEYRAEELEWIVRGKLIVF